MARIYVVGNGKAEPHNAPRGVGWIGGSNTPEEMPDLAPGSGWLWVTEYPAAIYCSLGGGTWHRIGTGDTARQILDKLLTVDADDSGLNASTLRGKAPADFLAANGKAADSELLDGRDSAAFQPAGSYAAANDARLRTVRDEGTSLANQPVLDFVGNGVAVTNDGVGGRTQVEISGAAAGAASETAAGITEQATQAEIEAGAAGNLFATVARLKAELDRRFLARRGHFAGNGPQIFTTLSIAAASFIVSGDLRGVGGTPADARGVYASVLSPGQTANRNLFVDSADAPNIAAASPRVILPTIPYAAQFAVPLGDAGGANAGKIKLSTPASQPVSGVDVWVTGWWR